MLTALGHREDVRRLQHWPDSVTGDRAATFASGEHHDLERTLAQPSAPQPSVVVGPDASPGLPVRE